jgi:hypothetical protein
MPATTNPAQTTNDPIYIVHGPVLYQLQVWSESEWHTTPRHRRPRVAEHAPGLGWVVAVRVECLN